MEHNSRPSILACHIITCISSIQWGSWGCQQNSKATVFKVQAGRTTRTTDLTWLEKNTYGRLKKESSTATFWMQVSDAAPYQRKFVEAVNWPWSRSSWFSRKQGSAGVLLQLNYKTTSTSWNERFSSSMPTRQDDMECRYMRRTVPRTTLVRCESRWGKVQEEQKRHLIDETTSSRTGVAGWGTQFEAADTPVDDKVEEEAARRTSSVWTTKANFGVDEGLCSKLINMLIFPLWNLLIQPSNFVLIVLLVFCLRL